MTQKQWGDGVVLCVTGLSRSERRHAEEIIEAAGGRYSPNLSKRCTHLLVPNSGCVPSTEKLRSAMRNHSKWGLELVRLDWLLVSSEEHRRQPEDRFSSQQCLALQQTQEASRATPSPRARQMSSGMQSQTSSLNRCGGSHAAGEARLPAAVTEQVWFRRGPPSLQDRPITQAPSNPHTLLSRRADPRPSRSARRCAKSSSTAEHMGRAEATPCRDPQPALLASATVAATTAANDVNVAAAWRPMPAGIPGGHCAEGAGGGLSDAWAHIPLTQAGFMPTDNLLQQLSAECADRAEASNDPPWTTSSSNPDAVSPKPATPHQLNPRAWDCGSSAGRTWEADHPRECARARGAVQQQCTTACASAMSSAEPYAQGTMTDAVPMAPDWQTPTAQPRDTRPAPGGMPPDVHATSAPAHARGQTLVPAGGWEKAVQAGSHAESAGPPSADLATLLQGLTVAGAPAILGDGLRGAAQRGLHYEGGGFQRKPQESGSGAASRGSSSLEGLLKQLQSGVPQQITAQNSVPQYAVPHEEGGGTVGDVAAVLGVLGRRGREDSAGTAPSQSQACAGVLQGGGQGGVSGSGSGAEAKGVQAKGYPGEVLQGDAEAALPPPVGIEEGAGSAERKEGRLAAQLALLQQLRGRAQPGARSTTEVGAAVSQPGGCASYPREGSAAGNRHGCGESQQGLQCSSQAAAEPDCTAPSEVLLQQLHALQRLERGASVQREDALNLGQSAELVRQLESVHRAASVAQPAEAVPYSDQAPLPTGGLDLALQLQTLHRPATRSSATPSLPRHHSSPASHRPEARQPPYDQASPPAHSCGLCGDQHAPAELLSRLRALPQHQAFTPLNAKRRHQPAEKPMAREVVPGVASHPPLGITSGSWPKAGLPGICPSGGRAQPAAQRQAVSPLQGVCRQSRRRAGPGTLALHADLALAVPSAVPQQRSGESPSVGETPLGNPSSPRSAAASRPWATPARDQHCGERQACLPRRNHAQPVPKGRSSPSAATAATLEVAPPPPMEHRVQSTAVVGLTSPDLFSGDAGGHATTPEQAATRVDEGGTPGGWRSEAGSVTMEAESQVGESRQALVFGGMTAIVDPELTPEEQERVARAIRQGGGSVAQHGARLGQGATHVVCAPEATLQWLALGLGIVSPQWVHRSLKLGHRQRCLTLSADATRHLPSGGSSGGTHLHQATLSDCCSSRGSMAPLPPLDSKEGRAALVAGLTAAGADQAAPLAAPPSLLTEVCWCVADPPSTATLDHSSRPPASSATCVRFDPGEVIPDSEEEEEWVEGRGSDGEPGLSQPTLLAYQEALHSLHSHSSPKESPENLGGNREGNLCQDLRPASGRQQAGGRRGWAREMVVQGVGSLTVVFPRDGRGEAGHDTRTFPLEGRCATAEHLLHLVHGYYQEAVPTEEQVYLIRTAPTSHLVASIVKPAFLDLRTLARHQLLGPRLSMEGLFKATREPGGAVYELRLAC